VVEGDGVQENDAPDTGPSTLPQQAEEKPTMGVDADAKAIPPHLRVHGGIEQPGSYEPRSAPAPAGAETVDMATFKPVFVPRAERETQKQNDKKKDGRGKEKKRAKAIVSFEDDDDDQGGNGGGALVIAPQQAGKDKDKDKARKKKKRRKEEKEEKGIAEGKIEEDTEMWVEKAPPQVVTSFVSAPLPLPPAERDAQVEIPVPPRTIAGPPRGRKRAIDFL
jgi:G patch domain-containing protein 1